MERRDLYRTGLAVVVLLSAIFLIGTNLSSASESPYSEFQTQSELPEEQREQLAPQANGITVVTSHLTGGNIIALNSNGKVLYHNSSHDGYWDVDHAQSGGTMVVYSATDEVRNRSVCSPVGGEDYCIRQTIEKTNLTTGETTVLYSQIDPRYHNSEWHDVDQINTSHYIVADMYDDEVFIVNTSSGVVTWRWSLQRHFPLTTGGQYPDDWAHLNDVEVLEDGRIMLSPRNMDQVIFVDPERGTVETSWTIGSDEQHDILHEQHNPDYIPESNGGPAVLIADSENGRVIEYQRQGSEWHRTWIWQDRQLQWPRDADRLPNGHTLVTDTHGGRVIEINSDGEIVWGLDVPTAYEAERLNTGDESEGGPSAVAGSLASQSLADAREAEEPSMAGAIRNSIKGLFPTKVVNAVANVTPPWVGFFDLAALMIGAFSIFVWVGLEVLWSDMSFRKPITWEN